MEAALRSQLTPKGGEVRLDALEIARKLTKARKKGNLYLIARYTMLLQLRGFDEIDLQPEESQALIGALDKTRQGKGSLPVEQGHEVARWIMLIDHFFPQGMGVLSSESDVELIHDAFEAYRASGNFNQLAGLKYTCDWLGVHLNIQLSEEETRKLDKVMATIE
jgi:hypothetical protein